MPVSKVIDFGVAKAIDQRLTEKTLFTHFGQIVGTFEKLATLAKSRVHRHLGLLSAKDRQQVATVLRKFVTAW